MIFSFFILVQVENDSVVALVLRKGISCAELLMGFCLPFIFLIFQVVLLHYYFFLFFFFFCLLLVYHSMVMIIAQQPFNFVENTFIMS